ncbi:uncharacterized protein [Primulina huaijiensis]|uniref:uncharacterized protein isoform X1 n=1 Tax=Primulina huaijiensis TaxID=1492673 RepID=UPI003CC733D1
MGCFLGCFGDAKDGRSRKQRIQRADSQVQLLQQNKVRSFQQQSLLLEEQSFTETPPPNLVTKLQNRPEGEDQLSPSPRKRVTFNANITTHEHYSLYESTDSLPEGNLNVQKEKELNPRSSSQPQFEEENSVKSCIVLYPPNHRYHNARDRDSEDEAEDYGDSDFDDLEDDYGDEDDIDCISDGQEMWSGSTLIPSLESRTENQLTSFIKTQFLEEDSTPVLKTQARNRSDYVNSVLNPVENVTQWKAAKSKGTCLLKLQKENNQSLFALSVRSDQFQNSNQETAVDASLSNWLVSSESTLPKKTSSSGIEYITDVKVMSKG